MKLLGTPLSDDRNFVPIWKQEAVDERGKKLWFHGAFTGGRSAGYHGTVGSKEGWTPSDFVPGKAQRIEDFIDDEDEISLPEHEAKQDHRLGEKVLRQMGWDAEDDDVREEPEHEPFFHSGSVSFVKATQEAILSLAFPRLQVPADFKPRPLQQEKRAVKRSIAAAALLREGDDGEETHSVSPEQAKLAQKGYQPFASVPLKQARYQVFLAHLAGDPGAGPLEPLPGLDLQREAEEFSRAALLFKPLPAPMAARFVTAGAASEQRKPTKMVASVERTISDWIPSQALCEKLGLELFAKVAEAPKIEQPPEVAEIVPLASVDLFKSIFGSDDEEERQSDRKRPLRSRPKASDFFT